MRHIILCCLMIFGANSAWAISSTPASTPAPAAAAATPADTEKKAPAPAEKAATPAVDAPAPATTSAPSDKKPVDEKPDLARKAPKADTSKAGDPFPRDVTVRYLESCSGLNKDMLDACKCMLASFQKSMSFDDFVKMSNSAKPDADPRFINVASHCIKSRQQ